MKDKVTDWNEPSLARWLGTITRGSTKAVYRSGLKLYLQFTGLTASQLVDEALEDARRDPRQRTDVVKRRLIGFYTWLVEEAPKKVGPGGKVIGKGLSSKIAHTYVGAVRSFYGTFEVFVKLRGRSRLPRPKVVNKRMILTNLDVKRLVDHASTPRDRAIILTMFQSGMDVSTLCSLKLGNVAPGLDRNEHPLKLNLYRPKTVTEYYTFLGRDSTEAIKAYLNSVKGRGIELKYEESLFLKLSHKALKAEGMTPNLVQNMLRELAIKAGFVNQDMNGRDFNPLSPHALRESFGSIMTSKGVPDTIVDFWLGHEIGQMAEAYKRGQFEDVKRMYLEREQYISITARGEVEEVLRAEIEDKTKQLQALVNGLASENLVFTSKVREHEKEFPYLHDSLQRQKSETERQKAETEYLRNAYVQLLNEYQDLKLFVFKSAEAAEAWEKEKLTREPYKSAHEKLLKEHGLT